ncbi:MAG: cupin-like domain-containing protein [Candidatus Rokuibacteriota bacterium]
MSATQVERVGRLTREGVGQLVHRGRPVVLTGALGEWPALAAWTPDLLGSRFWTRAVRIAVSGDGVFGYHPDAGAAYETVTMALGRAVSLICERVVTGKKHYLMQTSMADVLPELLGDVDTPPGIGTAAAVAHLWFGASGTVTPLHYDMANNFFAQIRGRKRITLYSPAQAARLYPFPASARHPHVSAVDIEAPDLARFPEFRKATALECVVGPGDLLFIPAFWWHHIRALDVTIAVSFWWGPRLAQYLAPAALGMIPVFYDRDRLAGIGRLLRDAGEPGGLLGAARFFQQRGRQRAAILFAAAALHEALAALRSTAGAPPPAAGLPPEPGPSPEPGPLLELAALSAALAQEGAIARPVHARVLACARVVGAARDGQSGIVSPSSAARIIRRIESLVAGFASSASAHGRRNARHDASSGARSSSGTRVTRS